LYPLLSLSIGVGAVVGILAVYTVAIRTRLHYVSTLTCPHCQGSFEYNWVPLASFSAVRLGRSRYMRCPLCHEWATFNIMSTRKRAKNGAQT